MPLTHFFSSNAHRGNQPLWSLSGGGLFVLIVSILAALVTFERSSSTATRIMFEKGVAVISALESGVRTGTRSRGGLRFQFLLEDLAGRRDVRFIALTMPDGTILAHSNPQRMGEILLTTDGRELSLAEMHALNPGENPAWTEMDMEGEPTFVVYGLFYPRPAVVGKSTSPSRATPLAPSRDKKPPLGSSSETSLPSESKPSGKTSSVGGSVPLPGSPPGLHVGQPLPTVFVGFKTRLLIGARQMEIKRALWLGTGVLVGGLLLLLGVHSLQRVRISRLGQRAAEAFAEELAVTLPDGLILLDTKGRIVRMNDAALRFMGFENPPQGRKAVDLLPEPVAQQVQALLHSETLADTEVTLDRAGRPLYLGVRGGHVEDGGEGRLGSIILLRDMSEVRRLEGEVRRREKLVAVGNLAAGVAHELRNPLSSIKGYATYFSSRFPEGSEDQEAAQVMISEADRLNRAITDLIGLARPTDIRLVPTDVVELVRGCMRLMRQDAATRKVDMRIEAETLPLVPVDPDRLRQVLLNLSLNALDAMAQGTSPATSTLPYTGVLTFSLHATATHMGLYVQDTGMGIPPEDLSHIFDPYFTTKGHGTGLGLATVHKIIEAHNGSIVVSSEVGKGTLFKILLPLHGGVSV